VFSFLSERSAFEDRLILEKEEWFPVSDAKWSKSIDDVYIFEGKICIWMEDTLDFHRFFWKIFDIVDFGKFLIHHGFEFLNLRGFYRKSCGLAMSSKPDEVFLTCLEEFDNTTPLRRPTGSDGKGGV
jgi:hypothetical protein